MDPRRIGAEPVHFQGAEIDLLGRTQGKILDDDEFSMQFEPEPRLVLFPPLEGRENLFDDVDGLLGVAVLGGPSEDCRVAREDPLG